MASSVFRRCQANSSGEDKENLRHRCHPACWVASMAQIPVIFATRICLAAPKDAACHLTMRFIPTASCEVFSLYFHKSAKTASHDWLKRPGTICTAILSKGHHNYDIQATPRSLVCPCPLPPPECSSGRL